MLAGSRRHLQSAGSRQRDRRPPADDASEEINLELPSYQEPRLPLTDEQQQQLRNFSASRFNANLQKHTEQSTKLLTAAVFAINERATNRKEAVARAIKRRRSAHNNAETDDDAEIETLRAKADEMKTLVDPLTLKVEKALRNILDMQAALQEERELLKELPAMVAMAQEEKAAGVQENAPQDEDDEPPEVTGVAIHRIIEQDREAKARVYDDLGMFEKYAQDNAYIHFKRNWHDGLNPGDDVPVPDPKTWFDRDGQPQHLTAVDEDDSDNELQISREVRSYRCPLSLETLTEPYTCRRCKHTFQKKAIYDYLQVTGPGSSGRRMKCPEAGCNLQDMRKADLFFDESLLRRMKRAEQAGREQEQESSDGEEEESREDNTVAAPVKVAPSEDEAGATDEDDY